MLKSAVGSMFLTRPFLVRFQKGQSSIALAPGKKRRPEALENPVVVVVVVGLLESMAKYEILFSTLLYFYLCILWQNH